MWQEASICVCLALHPLSWSFVYVGLACSIFSKKAFVISTFYFVPMFRSKCNLNNFTIFYLVHRFSKVFSRSSCCVTNTNTLSRLGLLTFIYISNVITFLPEHFKLFFRLMLLSKYCKFFLLSLFANFCDTPFSRLERLYLVHR